MILSIIIIFIKSMTLHDRGTESSRYSIIVEMIFPPINYTFKP